MKKYSGLLVVVGFLAFIALMASGFTFILHLFGLSGGIFGLIGGIANMILSIIALAAGWLWLEDAKMSKKAKTVLRVLFIVFAILALLGNVGF